MPKQKKFNNERNNEQNNEKNQEQDTRKKKNQDNNGNRYDKKESKQEQKPTEYTERERKKSEINAKIRKRNERFAEVRRQEKRNKKNKTDFVFHSGIVPVLPLRDLVLFPNMIVPLFVGRTASLKAIDYGVNNNVPILFISQLDPQTEIPKNKDLHTIGTLGQILQALKLPDDNVKILIEGLVRVSVNYYQEIDGILFADVVIYEDFIPAKIDIEGIAKIVLNRFVDYSSKQEGRFSQEIISVLSDLKDFGRLADTIIIHLPLTTKEKQKVLTLKNIQHRLELVLSFLEKEIKLLELEDNLRNRVKVQFDKSQREYVLTEKMKAIQEELKELNGGNLQSDIDKLEQAIEKNGLSQEAKEKALSEIAKLKIIHQMSPEVGVIRNYLDLLTGLPWNKKSVVNKDMVKAEEILNEDHYGLEKIKERITEYLAVQTRVEKVKGAILCLVGPPGVGKTSLGQSIAKATGREFVRMSLGGVRDEAEIRGHRRTYVGAMPGKIIQKLQRVKVNNPLFMLDEVDKMAMDFRGDPASALLEVLDPEQNSTFSDHYLEVDFDLSNVLFIATANSLDIPAPLLDRMEVIRLAGYTEDEKLNIAMRYLIPKQIKENGIQENELTITEDAVLEIIRYYTRESGVRNLERSIAKICRKVVKEILINTDKANQTIVVSNKNIEKYLGVRVFSFDLAGKNPQIGQVNGLAWTEVGGELLTIETVVMPGKGNTLYTGHLGEVMQESIKAALTVVRNRSEQFGIEPDFYEKIDIHVHVPEGATPKDGPSAGIGMCTALTSAITKIAVKPDVAMTGEITLRGEVLAIGGLKEKLLAALRSGIKTVIIPEENVKDLKEMPKNVTEGLDLKPVKWIEQALQIALEKMPEAKKEDVLAEKASEKIKKVKEVKKVKTNKISK